jgi:hypothetical protein
MMGMWSYLDEVLLVLDDSVLFLELPLELCNFAIPCLQHIAGYRSTTTSGR